MSGHIPVAVADTSALLAFFREDDKHYGAVREGFGHVGHLVMSPCVLAELDYLLAKRHGAHAANAALRHTEGRAALGVWEVPDIGPLLHAAVTLLGTYPDIGLTDALNVVLAREFRTDVIATLDRRHFRAVRPLTPHPVFRLLPDDVP